METLFGKCYESVGDINSDLLLKTRGEIKAQVGNKFINLLENTITGIDDNFNPSNIPYNNGIYVYLDGVYLIYNSKYFRLS